MKKYVAILLTIVVMVSLLALPGLAANREEPLLTGINLFRDGQLKEIQRFTYDEDGRVKMAELTNLGGGWHILLNYSYDTRGSISKCTAEVDSMWEEFQFTNKYNWRGQLISTHLKRVADEGSGEEVVYDDTTHFRWSGGDMLAAETENAMGGKRCIAFDDTSSLPTVTEYTVDAEGNREAGEIVTRVEQLSSYVTLLQDEDMNVTVCHSGTDMTTVGLTTIQYTTISLSECDLVKSQEGDILFLVEKDGDRSVEFLYNGNEESSMNRYLQGTANGTPAPAPAPGSYTN